MKRLFLAIDLPERIRDSITETYTAIPGAHWMRDDQLHITVRFLGEVPSDHANKIVHSLKSISVRPFQLSLKGTGVFPPRGETHILWIGIVPSPPFSQLFNQTETAVSSCGFQRESRRFSPHVTVARLKHAHPDRIAHYIVTNNLFTSAPFEVREFHLYSSHLGKEGARYTKEVSFILDTDS